MNAVLFIEAALSWLAMYTVKLLENWFIAHCRLRTNRFGLPSADLVRNGQPYGTCLISDKILQFNLLMHTKKQMLVECSLLGGRDQAKPFGHEEKLVTS